MRLATVVKPHLRTGEQTGQGIWTQQDLICRALGQDIHDKSLRSLNKKPRFEYMDTHKAP